MWTDVHGMLTFDHEAECISTFGTGESILTLDFTPEQFVFVLSSFSECRVIFCYLRSELSRDKIH